jgi:hypothetical protein
MSSKKINIKNSFFCKKDFFNSLNFMCLAMRSCRNYAMSNKVYCVNNNFKKCVKHVRLNRNYNLTILSISIKRIYEKRLRLKKEMRKTCIKLSRLKRQLNFLKKNIYIIIIVIK